MSKPTVLDRRRTSCPRSPFAVRQFVGDPAAPKDVGRGLPKRVRYTYQYTFGFEMRTNIVLDDDLVEQAFALTGIRTKRELVHVALSELVRQRQKKDLFDLAGKVKLRPDLDHKEMRRLRDSSD